MAIDLQHWHRGGTPTLALGNDDGSATLVEFKSIWDNGPRWGVQVLTVAGERERLIDVVLSTRSLEGSTFGAFTGCVWVRLDDGRFACVGYEEVESAASDLLRELARGLSFPLALGNLEFWCAGRGIDVLVNDAETKADCSLTALDISARLRGGEPVESIAAFLRADVDDQQHRRSVAIARRLFRCRSATVAELAEKVPMIASKKAATRRAGKPLTSTDIDTHKSTIRHTLARLRDRGVVEIVEAEQPQRWAITDVGQQWLRDIDKVEAERERYQEAI